MNRCEQCKQWGGQSHESGQHVCVCEPIAMMMRCTDEMNQSIDQQSQDEGGDEPEKKEEREIKISILRNQNKSIDWITKKSNPGKWQHRWQERERGVAVWGTQ